MNYFTKLMAYCLLLAGFIGGSAIAQTVNSTVVAMSGEILTQNKAYYSPDGSHFLIFQGDGNLVIYHASSMKPAWSAASNGANFAIMQWDGNFVVYRGTVGQPNPVPVWSSGTWSNTPDNGSAEVRLYDNGRMTVRGNDGKTFETRPATTMPICTAPGPFAACMAAGTPWQYSGVVWACSYEQAARTAFEIGARIGPCW